MNDINAKIKYDWKYSWEGVSEESPTVNLLLKAIIEHDIAQADYLYTQGAELEKCDRTTLQRILFEVMDDYNIVKWLIDHGMSNKKVDYEKITNGECVSTFGYVWGLPARAYYMGAYDVFNLLCSNGFSNFNWYEENWNSEDADKYIIHKGDEKGLKILLENGYADWPTWKNNHDYEMYVLNRPQVRRRTNGLDAFRFKDYIPKPELEDVPLLFGRKEVKRRNERRIEDYDDRARAYSEFENWFGVNQFRKYVKELSDQNKILGQAMMEISSKW